VQSRKISDFCLAVHNMCCNINVNRRSGRLQVQQRQKDAVRRCAMSCEKASSSNQAVSSEAFCCRETECRSGTHIVTQHFWMMLPTCLTWRREQASYASTQRELFLCGLRTRVHERTMHWFLPITARVRLQLQACS
jgi:hypothetical protein